MRMRDMGHEAEVRHRVNRDPHAGVISPRNGGRLSANDTCRVLVIAQAGRDQFVDDQICRAANGDQCARLDLNTLPASNHPHLIWRVGEQHVQAGLGRVLHEEHRLSLICQPASRFRMWWSAVRSTVLMSRTADPSATAHLGGILPPTLKGAHREVCCRRGPLRWMDLLPTP